MAPGAFRQVWEAAARSASPRRSAADGSAVRSSARSRSFREDENSRLRRGWAAGSGPTARQGERDRARWPPPAMVPAVARSATWRTSVSRGFSRPGWSRPNTRPSFSAACLADVPAGALTAARAWSRNSNSDPAGDRSQLPDHRAEAEHNHSGAASDGARENQSIAETEFLDRNPESDRCKARQHKTNAGDQQESHHQTHPTTVLDSTRTAKATITSYCVHRQPTMSG